MAGTGALNASSQLVRNKWVREGLIQKASRSFWAPYTGKTADSIIYQVNDASKETGHQIRFDFSGNLTQRARKNKETAVGTGEVKRKFSDLITVNRYRQVVDNGDKFDGVNIGDLSINEHSDSRAKLSDLWIRFKDQGIFDAAQGLNGQTATHQLDLGTTFTLNQLTDLEDDIKTSSYNIGGIRRPLQPYYMDSEGKPVWLFILDTSMLKMLRQDSTFQTAMINADTRGDKNRIIAGKVGRVGNLLLVEADRFFGVTDNLVAGWGLNQSDVEISGLRQYKGADPTTALWSGQAGFTANGDALHSRGVILGAGAIQFGMGKEPDYDLQFSQDFKITSESMLQSWLAIQKTKMTAEGEDYVDAKVAGVDWGCVVVDLAV